MTKKDQGKTVAGNPITEPKGVAVGQLAHLLGVDVRQIQRIGEAGHFPKPTKKGEYDLAATARGVIEYYKRAAEKVSDSKAADAAAREHAERLSSEVDLAKTLGRVIQMDDCRLIWSSGMIELRKRIVGAGLCPDCKAKVAEVIKTTKLDTNLKVDGET